MDESDSREEVENSLLFRYTHYTLDYPRALHDLRRVYLECRVENRKLAAENDALRQQTARKELSWEQEKNKLLDERDSLASALRAVRDDMESRLKVLGSASVSQKLSDTECKQVDRKKDKKEVRSLKESLRCQQMETEKVRNSWKAERDHVREMKLSFDRTLLQFNAEWESRRTVGQERATAKLNALQQDCEEEESQVIQGKDDGITGVIKEMTALVEENLAKLRALDTEIHQSKREWKTRQEALEDHLRFELEAKEESFQETQELQKQIREMEEKWLSEEEELCAKEEEWCAKEEDWLNKTSQMEDEMKLIIQQNIELQDLASKTDKEKAKMRKEEKKAKKETEKTLKKERKEKEEREKKEKIENEKKEKERLKREKKENEEREKKEKKERKKREKTEKERKTSVKIEERKTSDKKEERKTSDKKEERKTSDKKEERKTSVKKERERKR